MIQPAALLGLSVVGATAAMAAEAMTDKLSAPTTFNIPAQPLGISLKQLTNQAGIQILFEERVVEGLSAPALRVRLSPRQALDTLLKDTGLEFTSNDQTIVVREKPSVAAPSSSQKLRQTGDATALGTPAPMAREDSASWGSIRLAQADTAAGTPASTPAAETTPDGERRANSPEQEVIVTGSRIQQTGMTTPTPVTAVSIDELQKLAPGNLSDALDQVPQFLNNQSGSENASTGQATGGTNLNLRGLGINRTLVLVNGMRAVPNSKLGAVNIDILPQAIVKRVDIVTGGASAAYGTDAVAGVVNFILDTEFTGLKGNVQGGISSREDLGNTQAEIAFGRPIGEKAHLILTGEAFKENGTRDWTGRDWFQGYSAMTNPEFVATGMGPRLITARNVVGTDFTCGGLIELPGSAINRLQFMNDGSVQPYVRSGLSVVGTGTRSQSIAPEYGGGSGCDPASFTGNRGDGPSAGNDRNRGTLFSYFNYDVNDSLNLFTQLTYSQEQIGINNPSATMAGAWAGRIFVDNAFLPESVRDVMIAENRPSFVFQRNNADIIDRATELFGRAGRVNVRNRTLAATVGFEAGLGDEGFLEDWKLNGHYTYGKNKQRSQQIGYMRIQTLPLAMDAVVDPATGQIVCRAKLLGVDASSFGPQSLIDSCVPLNLFGDSNFSDDAVRYVTTPTSPQDTLNQNHHLVQHDAELVASGKLFEGWGAGPLSGAFGVSYRKQDLSSFENPDYLHVQSTPTNNVPGIRGVPGGFAGDVDIHQFDSFTDVNGSLNVKEAFFETLVPLVSGLPLMQQLNANASARWAKYSGSGDIWAYKFGLDWQLVDDLRLRSTYSRDVRAASLAERFDTDRGSGTVNDPVTGSTVTFSQTNGGNPEVAPEEADTFTFGAVYQPSWANGLSLSLDWWQIDVAGAIGQLGAQKIVDDCLAGATSLCPLITREAGSNTIVDLKNVFININQEKASGLDIEAAYSRGIEFVGGGPERLGFRMFAAYLNELSRLIPGAPLDDQAGDILNGTPEWFVTASFSYENGPFSFDVKESVIGSGVRNTAEIEGIHIDENDVPAAYYTDLRFGYAIDRPGGSKWEIFANVINLFDETPQLAVGNWSSNNGATQTNTDLYDVKGRRYVLGAKFEF